MVILIVRAGFVFEVPFSQWVSLRCNEFIIISIYGIIYVVRCAIRWHLYNSQNVRNTHGGVLIWCFSRFLNCTSATKSRNAPHTSRFSRYREGKTKFLLWEGSFIVTIVEIRQGSSKKHQLWIRLTRFSDNLIVLDIHKHSNPQ